MPIVDGAMLRSDFFGLPPVFTRADTTTTGLEPSGKHGVSHAPTKSHYDTTSHDTKDHDETTAHDTTAHDTTTPVCRHDDSKSTIHRQP